MISGCDRTEDRESFCQAILLLGSNLLIDKIISLPTEEQVQFILDSTVFPNMISLVQDAGSQVLDHLNTVNRYLKVAQLQPYKTKQYKLYYYSSFSRLGIQDSTC